MYLYKRDKVYYVVYFKDKKRIAVSSKTSNLLDAKLFLKSYIPEDRNKIQIPFDLDQLWKEFFQANKALVTYKTICGYIETVTHCFHLFPNKQLTAIDTNSINAVLQYRIRKSGMWQARKDRLNLHRMFNYAINREYLDKNPVSRAIKIKVPEVMPDHFSKVDYDRFINKVDNKDLRDIYNFAVNTGLRQMELITLEWSQVDLINKFVILNNKNHITKSKKVRTIPLNNAAFKVLADRDKRTDYIFEYKNKKYIQKSMSKIFKKFVILAGINSKLHFHSLRHTFASWLVQAGVSIFVVKELLGHSDIKTTMIYAKLNQDNLRDSVNRI